jgi:hypothetical protein
VKPVKVSAKMKAHPLNKSRLAKVPDHVNPFAVAKFPEPLSGIPHQAGLLRVNPPLFHRIDTLCLALQVFGILPLHQWIGPPVP